MPGRPILIAIAWLACAGVHGEEVKPMTMEEVREAEARIRRFLETELLDPGTGAVFVNAATDRPVVAGEARNRDCLSEAVGQMMELALVREDRESFERQFALARERFAGESGFLAWKIALDPFRRADTSATLDDWRVAYACALADRLWTMPEAAEFGRSLAAKIVRGSGGRPVPPPAFNLGDGSPGGGAILLCYLHLPVMALFAPLVPDCDALLESSRAVLENLPPPAGMVPQRWNPEDGAYSPGASDEVLAMITLLHLHGVDSESPVVAEAIRVRLALLDREGRLPQTFDAGTGEPLSTPAGASVYALFARLLIATGRTDAAAICLRKMLEYQNPASSEHPGAIGKYPVFSFDQLEALLALEEFLRAGRAP